MSKDREQESVNEPATDSSPAPGTTPAAVQGCGATAASSDGTGCVGSNDKPKLGFGPTAPEEPERGGA